ncbi:hypothetical protein AWB64_00466 [Caballeronia sordidicola]|uniref:Uncharacterized protein n=1 Tax=Caballeronia sordidicola TaxID=196367 RepID=A0A158EWV3_CABSO|nr:hypothetical protein [Caballeronia sordidicola]SAL12024.1 hypothetical protein AWB64_00466 [Caballeronia sordidicola]
MFRRRYELGITHAAAANSAAFVAGLNADDQDLLFDIGRSELSARVSLAQQSAIDGSLPLCFMWGQPDLSIREACVQSAILMRQQNAFSCRKSSTKAPRPRAWTERHYRSLRREYAAVLHYWMAANSMVGNAPSYEALVEAVSSELFAKLAESAMQFIFEAFVVRSPVAPESSRTALAFPVM